jgi:hypothetical protein
VLPHGARLKEAAGIGRRRQGRAVMQEQSAKDLSRAPKS